MDLNEIMAFVSVTVDCFVIFQILIFYRHFRYPTLRLFLLSILLLAVADLEPVSKYMSAIGFGDSVIITAFDVILRGFATFSILLVFDATTNQTSFTGRNLLLGALLVLTSTGVVVIACLMKIEELNLYAGLPHVDFTLLSDFSGLGLVFLAFFLLFLFWGDVLIVTQVALIIVRLGKQKKESAPNPERRHHIQNIQVGCYLLIIGSFLITVLPFLGDALEILGLLLLIWNIRKGGQFFISEPSLRYLIAMDQGGIPLFSFSFQIGSVIEPPHPEPPSPEQHKDALYSGAISGISSLISEMVDSKQKVERSQCPLGH